MAGAKEKHLTVVDPSVPQPGVRPESVSQAVTDGSPRDVNVAMQDRIARAIDADDIRGADLAALSRRLHELRKELATLDAQAREEVEDDSAEDETWTAI